MSSIRMMTRLGFGASADFPTAEHRNWTANAANTTDRIFMVQPSTKGNEPRMGTDGHGWARSKKVRENLFPYPCPSVPSVVNLLHQNTLPRASTLRALGGSPGSCHQ